jgi:hypothetical protein
VVDIENAKTEARRDDKESFIIASSYWTKFPCYGQVDLQP